MSELLTVADVARITALSEWTVRQACRDGELRAHKLRGRYRVSPDDLAAWLDDALVTHPSITKAAERANVMPRQRPRLPAGSARQAVRDHHRSAA